MLRLLPGLFAGGLMALASAGHAQTLESIRAANHHGCGTVHSADDWNGEDVHGNLSALGGEICRAVAVAILGEADNVTIQPFPAELEALAALKAGRNRACSRHLAFGDDGDPFRRRVRTAGIL